MKKALSVLLTVILAVSCISMAFISFAGYQCKLYGHRYTEWEVVKDATCVSKGIESRYCEYCHDYQKEDIPIDSSNHANYSGCTSNSNGTHHIICADCKVEADVNCSYGSWTIKDDNTDTGVCRWCQYQGDVACKYVNPEKLTDTQHTCTCSQCGREKSFDCEFNKMTTVKVTCTTGGYKVLACVCGNEDDNTITSFQPAKGHTDADDDGVCDECGFVIKVKEPEPTVLDKIKAFFQKIFEFFTGIFG